MFCSLPFERRRWCGAAYLASLEPFDESAVDTERARSRRQTKNKFVLRSRVESLDAVDDVVGDIGARRVGVVANNQSHDDVGCLSLVGAAGVF